MILIGEENTQAHTDSEQETREWAKASGPDKENQPQAPTVGPEDSQPTQGKTLGAELGLTHSGPKFVLRPTSPREIKIKSLKKPKGGGQKENKDNRGHAAKEKVTG